MKLINYNHDKSELLKTIRGVSFKEVAEMVIKGDIFEVVNNPGYPNQMAFILKINGYFWVCPFVENDVEIFLKTLYPSRKANKLYKGV